MDVRVYEAFSMPEAIKMIKHDLGRDAIILSTKEKNVFEQNSGKTVRMYEVLASACVSENTNRGETSGKVFSSQVGEQLAKPFFPHITKTDKSVSVIKSAPPNIQHQPLQRDAQARPQSTSSKQERNDPVEWECIRSEIHKMRKEIEQIPQIDMMSQMQEIKVILHDMMIEKYKTLHEIKNPHLLDLCIRLRIAGVQESFINHLSLWLEKVTDAIPQDERAAVNEKIENFYLNETIKFIFKYIKIHGSFYDPNCNKKIVCLVGPTGVGKTTTLAKIAAHLKLNHKKEVAFISADSYRVGATDQMRVYAKILNVPFYEVSDPQELVSCVSKLASTPYILIDTAGRNVRAKEQADFLRNLSDLPLPLEFHLVVSSTMKQRDIDETIRNYRMFLNIDSIVFTKLDESWAFGEILNSSLQGKLALSYFTTGQRVPEDLELATKERVIERLLGM